MKKTVGCLLISLLCSPLLGQLTGHVNYERLGIAFDIPSGWFGQEGEGMLLLQSQSTPGLIMILPHNENITQLTIEARKGINEGNGTVLKLSGPLSNLSTRAVGGEFSGTMEWQPATAYIIGMANPNEHGPGVYIVSATTKDQYSPEYENLAKQVFRSVQFSETNLSSEITEWKRWLSDVRLTYMSSHYSSDYTPGGISGGYSSTKIIDLCSKGHFIFNSNSDMSMSGDGVSAYSSGNNDGQGTWNIQANAMGEIMLTLEFHNGNEHQYRLEYIDEELRLDGTRYFRTTDGEYAPNCY